MVFGRIPCSEFNKQFDSSNETSLSRDCNVTKERTRVTTRKARLFPGALKKSGCSVYIIPPTALLVMLIKNLKEVMGLTSLLYIYLKMKVDSLNKSLVWHDFIEVYSSGADLNGTKDSSMIRLEEDSQRASDGSTASARDILARRLINLGNLGFPNATLQALLSCSPFVQLSQGQRKRHIYKV